MRKAAKPSLTPAKIRRALEQTALDIEGFGRDRDSGFGIVDAFAALSFVRATPAVFLELGTVTAAPASGDGDAFIEPGESANISAQLVNIGGLAATGVSGNLTTTTPEITLTAANSAYPNIPPGGGTGTNNTPFAFSLSPTAECGVGAHFTLTASYAQPGSPKAFNFSVKTGQPGTTPTNFSYAGPGWRYPTTIRRASTFR